MKFSKRYKSIVAEDKVMMFTRKKMDRLFGQLDNWLTVLIQAMIYYDFIVEAELKLLILI